MKNIIEILRAFIFSVLFVNMSFATLNCIEAVEVSGGEDHTLVLMDNATLWACGGNSFYQLGNGSNYGGNFLNLDRVVDGKAETETGYLENVALFDAGWMHSLASNSDGYVYAWGSNDDGRLGIGRDLGIQFNTPQIVLSGEQNTDPNTVLSNIVSISAGRSGQHSLAADSAGHVFAWGLNASYQCGSQINGLGYVELPHYIYTDDDPAVKLGSASPIIDVQAGIHHSTALDQAGDVWEWGDGTEYAKKIGFPDPNNTEIIAISSCDYTAALDSSGMVWSWEEACGTPSLVTDGDMETTSGYLENIVDVRVGSDYCLGLDSSGYVWEWDTGGSPSLVTDGEMETSSGYLENIAAIEAGYKHVLAIDIYGNVWSWEDNGSGQLGDGTNTFRAEPVLMNCALGESDLHITKEMLDFDTCITPGDEIEYEIDFRAVEESHTNVVVIDYLPDELTFVSADPNTAVFDFMNNTVTWEIGTLEPSETSTVFSLTVMLNPQADPVSDVVNYVWIESDTSWAETSETNPVCCWADIDSAPGVIYVNATLDPNNYFETGTSWETAYTKLSMAIDRINNARALGIECGSEIWVAHGNYSPGESANDKFEIPYDIEVYGGFIGNEEYRTDRNWGKYYSTLKGNAINNNLVVLQDDTVLDGFVVKNSVESGISGDSADCTIANTVISNSGTHGIDFADSDVIVDSCVVKNSGEHGISHTGSSNSLTIKSSKIFGNQKDGVYCENSTPTVTNCMIYKNGSSGYYHGVNLNSPSSVAVFRNNTIAYNKRYGVSYSGSNAPTITNSILWGNGEIIQLPSGCDVTYSCVQDPNTSSSTPDSTYNNIHCYPDFAYGDPNVYLDFHLSSNSTCIDLGYNTGVGIDETDIDGETRIVNGGISLTVDMGADEYVYCSDGISHEYDINADGIINQHEFGGLAETWLLTSSDPNWYDTWDMDDDNTVDIDDLSDFTSIWLWSACWYDATPMSVMSTMTSFMLEPVMLEAENPYADEYANTVYIDPAEAAELPLEAQLYRIADIIDWLEKIPVEYPDMMADIDMDDWNEFLEKLYAEELRLLEAIEARDNPTSTKSNKKRK